jgi:predicted permease
MDHMRRDLSQAVRGLRANPGYTLAAVLTLAIGIGANAAVFNLGHWLLLRPIPGIQNPDRLVSLSLMASDRSGARFVSNPEVEALREGITGLTGLAAYQQLEMNVAAQDGPPQRVSAAVVTDNFFDVLGGPVAHGRGFTREEGTSAGAPSVAVVSNRFWVASLGRAADAVGRTITINGGTFTVVGIAVAGFHGPSRAGDTDVWVPIGQHRFALPMYSGDVLTNERSSVFFSLVGRLRDGVTVAQAEAEGNAVRAARTSTGTRGRPGTWELVGRSGTESTPWMQDRVARLLTALVAGVVLLLVLTCANVGNLILARAGGRRAEVATRLAFGASRVAVGRLLLVESLVLALVAGGLALAVTWLLGRAFDGTAILPGVVTLGRVPLDWQVLAFACAMSVAVASVAGIVPAVATSRMSPQEGMRGTGRGQVGGGGRLRQVLTAAQVAVSVTLLLGAMLLVRSVDARFAIPLGFDPTQVLSMSLEPALQRYTPQRTDAFYQELMTAVRQVPGVHAAGLAWLAPFSRTASDSGFWAEGGNKDEALSANHNMVSPGYLAAMGVPLLAGRDFSETEFMRRSTPDTGVVILTESLARRLFEGGTAVGRRITMQYPEGHVRTIVGVIPDQRQHRLMDETADLLLEPFGQPFTSGFASLQLSMAGSSEQVVAGVVGAIRRLDPTLPVYGVETVDMALRRTMTEELLVSRSVSVFAVLAMLVAAVGLGAVLARTVSERQREFGVRLACGATPGRLMRHVAREAVTVTGVGLLIGFGMAAWFVRVISARLYGVEPGDPQSAVVVVLGVMTVALVAAAVPARRAARVDPARVLR